MELWREELYHHGIKGQKWGIRRYQNEDGSLTEAGRKRYQKEFDKDVKWAGKRELKIRGKAFKKVEKELSNYVKERSKDPRTYKEIHYMNGTSYKQPTQSFVNEYNKKMADLMTKQVRDLKTPHGHTISFVAARGQEGVYMIVHDTQEVANYVKRGIWSDGRIAYRKQKLELSRTHN